MKRKDRERRLMKETKEQILKVLLQRKDGRYVGEVEIVL